MVYNLSVYEQLQNIIGITYTCVESEGDRLRSFYKLQIY